MGAWKKVLVHVAWSGLFLSGFPGLVLPVAAQQAAANQGERGKPAQSLVASAEDPAKPAELPDSPGETAAKAAETAQAQGGGEKSFAVASASAQSQSPPTQSQQPVPQKPVGTAAAEAPNASGVAASQPAGVAIAPAKQRRVRTIVLRLGAIAGAGVAVGSVVALTAATSSKPPGAH